ncbi:YybH family protein [Shewanella gelidii]|uniref:DUF4440 domain-containing protein n=1 Tax=Shewanella gelidii TaxID=1642821 RepID=A0A917JW10_9GAMM|nr:nuclear transport factor 2 family protein [Shewanella gelidii]MCL1097984.1 nuclear transport factor 2 family protein [Shewanella gelidii]GGI85181.1 hypothetical protein GCM10009332_23160 [Shewanella gelidii]
MRQLFFILIIVASLGFTATTHADNANVHDELNKTYQRFADAFSQLDIGLVEDVYAENACYIPAGQSNEITHGRQKIISIYETFFGKIKHKNAKIEVDFRVINRKIDGNSATDVGYYLIRFHPAKETEEPISEFAGKFVTVSSQNSDGKWYLTVDTNNKAEPSFYQQAEPTNQAYFGKQFDPIPSHK